MQCASSTAMNRTPDCCSRRRNAGPPSPAMRSGDTYSSRQRSVAQARDDRVAFLGRLRAVQIRRRHAVDAQAVDLILHQRDERRDHHADAVGLDDRRRLEAQRLAAAGRQHDDAVARRENRVHRLALERTEARETPDAVERVLEDDVVRRRRVSVGRICARRNHRRGAGTVPESSSYVPRRVVTCSPSM